jgi:hypothetical protein
VQLVSGAEAATEEHDPAGEPVTVYEVMPAPLEEPVPSLLGVAQESVTDEDGAV